MATYLKINEQNDRLVYKDAPYAVYKPIPYIDVESESKNIVTIKPKLNFMRHLHSAIGLVVKSNFLLFMHSFIFPRIKINLHTDIKYTRHLLVEPFSRNIVDIESFNRVTSHAKPELKLYGNFLLIPNRLYGETIKSNFSNIFISDINRGRHSAVNMIFNEKMNVRSLRHSTTLIFMTLIEKDFVWMSKKAAVLPKINASIIIPVKENRITSRKVRSSLIAEINDIKTAIVINIRPKIQSKIKTMVDVSLILGAIPFIKTKIAVTPDVKRARDARTIMQMIEQQYPVIKRLIKSKTVSKLIVCSDFDSGMSTLGTIDDPEIILIYT